MDAANAAMDEALKNVEDNFPQTVTVGDQTVAIDTAKVGDVIERERKFWQNDARNVEDLGKVVVRDPFERAEVRIAMSVSKVFQPLSDLFATAAQGYPNSEACQVDQFIDCLWKLPAW